LGEGAGILPFGALYHLSVMLTLTITGMFRCARIVLRSCVVRTRWYSPIRKRFAILSMSGGSDGGQAEASLLYGHASFGGLPHPRAILKLLMGHTPV
jgi:hypothetical protein